MKLPIRLLITSLLCTMSLACQHSPQQLATANALVAEHPDSALVLLGQIASPQNLSARDYARYALYTTRARYQLGQELITDTLAEIAVNYYRKHPGDSTDAYRAFYFAAQIARARKEPEKAMPLFLQAREMLATSRNLQHHYVIETWIGVLSGEQQLYQQKINQARIALKYADSLDNDDYRSISLGDIAHGFLGLRQNDSVERYAREGLRIAEKTGVRSTITQKLALLTQILIEEGRYHPALEINARSIRTADSDRLHGFYMERAEIYNKLGLYDSAFYYLARSRVSPEPLMIVDQAIHIGSMAEAYAGTGRYDSAYYQMVRYTELLDSVNKQVRTTEVLETEQLWKYSNLREENLLLRAQKLQRERWNYRMLLFFGLASLVIGSCYFITYRRNKMRIIRQQQEIIAQHELLKLRTREKQQVDQALIDMQRKEDQLRSLFFKQLSLPTIPEQEDSTHTLRLTDADWQVIYRHADAVFGNFTLRLRERYPALNEEDLRFCCMVKMQLSQSEIAGIVCLEKDSVKKRLKRIRMQKMAASEGTTIEELLRNF